VKGSRQGAGVCRIWTNTHKAFFSFSEIFHKRLKKERFAVDSWFFENERLQLKQFAGQDPPWFRQLPDYSKVFASRRRGARQQD
jgi:hypothetical protein